MIAASLVLAFFLGSVPFSWLLVRALDGSDLRDVGSGNPGATNAWRVVGPKWGTLALALDISKGWAAVMVPPLLSGENSPEWIPAACGFAAILGNVFCPFLRFKGGKAVATGAGVFLALAPIGFGIALSLFAVAVWKTRKISVGSLLAATFLPLCLTFEWQADVLDRPDVFTLALVWIAAITILGRHAGNIRRLFEGSEVAFTEKVEGKDGEPND